MFKWSKFTQDLLYEGVRATQPLFVTDHKLEFNASSGESYPFLAMNTSKNNLDATRRHLSP
jgi:hypothetical protein